MLAMEATVREGQAPAVVVDPDGYPTWGQWEWMSRYRVWEANREVFLYPENWLIESQRPNRTEIFQKLEQEVHQGQATKDYLETVVLNYLDRLDGLAHLQVTGTCEDPATGSIHVVARSLADPPVFYLRSYVNAAWSGWVQIPLDIKAHQVVPAVYRGRVCLFWLDVKVSNEPHQTLAPVEQSSSPPSQTADQYVALGVHFSTFRNGSWAPAQVAKGKLFDKPFYVGDPADVSASDAKTVESLYTIKVQPVASSPGYGVNLSIDVFRLGEFQVGWFFAFFITGENDRVAVHLGRATFDGRFADLELRNLEVPTGRLIDFPFPLGTDAALALLDHAQATYGPDAWPLLPLAQPDPNIVGDSGLVPEAGVLMTPPPDSSLGTNQTLALNFTSASALEQNVGPLLRSVPVPFRVVGPDSDLNFDPGSYFFFQDNRRCYWVEAQRYYWAGSMWSPVVPSDPSSAPYQVRYVFHPFYHPFTRLLWNQLAAGGFDLFYTVNLQQNPDQIDPSGADVFGFQAGYQPFIPRVWWDHDDVTGADRQFLDFGYSGPFSVYNWELFYHVPLYVAQLLSQNQQFVDAQSWFHYIFNPARPGADPLPERFWIPKPLHNLTGAEILLQQINNLLEAVNQGNATDVAQIRTWRQEPFNPFVLADLRLGVPYMKSTVMAYLDNLIAWADNLFYTESREALSEATLLYVIASEILGPSPIAVTPSAHAEESFEQLEPALDAFANAMVDIENVIGGAGGGGGDAPTPSTSRFPLTPSCSGTGTPSPIGCTSCVTARTSRGRRCNSPSSTPRSILACSSPPRRRAWTSPAC